jgi:hypothetical protein
MSNARSLFKLLGILGVSLGVLAAGAAGCGEECHEDEECGEGGHEEGGGGGSTTGATSATTGAATTSGTAASSSAGGG